MKKLLIFVLLSTMLLSVTACGTTDQTQQATTEQQVQTASDTAAATDTTGSSDQVVKLRMFAYWNSEDIGRLPKEWALNEMKSIMPNVEIEVVPSYAQDDSLTIWAASGQLPDIIEPIYATLVKTLSQSNSIIQLDKYLDESKILDKYRPNYHYLFESEDGHCYAVPTQGNDTVLIFYNKTLFAKYNLEAPTDFDKFMKAADTFNENDIVPLALWGKEPWTGISLLDGFITRSNPDGIKVFNGKVDLSSDPCYLDAAKKIQMMAQRNVFPKGLFNMTYNEAYALFTQGKAAMFQNGTWNFVDIINTLKDDVDFVSCPWGDAATMEKTKYNLSGGGLYGSCFSISNGKNSDIAAKFLMEFAPLVCKGNILKKGKPEAFLVEEVKSEVPISTQQEKLMDLLKNAQHTSYLPWNISDPKMNAALEPNTANLLTGKFAPEEFIEQLQKANNEVYK